MPDYGGDKGFGSDKDDPGKDRSTGGNKPGQGSGYNTPGPQYGGSLADTQNKLGTQYSPELAAAITASNKAAFDNRTKRDFINRMAKLEASSGQKKSFGQGLKKFGQGIMSNLTPQRMLGSALGTALLGPFGGILGGLIGGTYGDDDPSNNFFGKIGSSLKKDATDTIDFGKQIGSNLQTDFLDTVNFFRPNFNVDTPDADLVRAGDFNFIDRITNAIAAPNISTGVGELFKPRAMGLPEDFLDQSAVETQQLNPVMGMQYDDFVNPQDLQTIGMNQVDAINRLNTNINEQQTGDFNMPMINPELGATNMYPSGQAIEVLPGQGVIFNDPALMAPNEVVVDPFSGQLVPNVNVNIPRTFDI